MREGEILRMVDLMIFQIGVVTGWQLPDSQLYKDKIREQLKRKCKESYSDLNFHEIEFAFRQYGSQVEDWGKAMNLSLIDKVINLYRADREVVSLIEEQKYKPVQKIFTQDELDNFSREDAQRQYGLFLRGYELINPELNKDILIKDGLIKEGETVIGFFASMAEKNKPAIYQRQ